MRFSIETPRAPARDSNKYFVRTIIAAGVILAASAPLAQRVYAQDPSSSQSETADAAQAAPSGQAAQQAQAGNAAEQLGEVTVTANRFEENVQKVPITVTAITGVQLEEQNIQTVDSVFNSAPDVVFYRTMQGGGQNSELVIRGIQSTTGEGTTGVYIDDTPIQLHKGGISFTAQNDYPDIFDLDRVEILEGPQGTLFGQGAMGGAVRFITRQPSLDTWSVYAKTSEGFTDGGDPSYALGVAFGGPIIDDVLGFRLSLDTHYDGGWVNHTSDQDYAQAYEQSQAGYDYGNSNGVEKYSNWGTTNNARIAFTWEPVQGLVITPSYTYQYRYSNAQSVFYARYSNVSDGDLENVTGVPEPEFDNYRLPTLNVRYHLPGVDLFSNTSYYYRNEYDYYNNTDCDMECTPASPTPVGFPLWYPTDPTLKTNLWDHNQQKNFVQEFRAASPNPSSNFTWQAGLFYSHNVAQSQEYAPLSLAEYNSIGQAFGYPTGYALFGFNLLPDDLSYNTLDLVTDKHVAAFGEVNYKLLEKLTLTAGLRVERVTSDLISEQGGPYAEKATLSGYQTSISATPVTPKFSASYQLTPDDMVYGTIAEAYREGGSNGPLPPVCATALLDSGLSGLTGAYQGDHVWSYEVGAKDKFADNRVLLNSSLYWINWSKIQESLPLQNAAGDCIQNVITNGNSLTSKGVSLQAQVIVLQGLTWSGSIGWDQALFNDSLYGEGAGGAPVIIIHKGDGIDGAPPVTAQTAIQYQWQILTRPTFVRIDYRYISEERMQPDTDPVTSTYYYGNLVRPVTNVANIRMGVTFDNLQAQIFVTNFTNAQPLYQTNAGEGNNGIEEQFISIRPREVGVTGLYNF